MSQALPRLRFNKEGNLLAVTTADNGFKILGNAAGLRSVRAIEAPSFEALRMPIDSASIKVIIISLICLIDNDHILRYAFLKHFVYLSGFWYFCRCNC